MHGATEQCVYPEQDQFALLVSALCHDIGHDGNNNPYHVQRKDELAMLYNDTSPLENLHARSCFEAASAEGCDVFAGLDKKDYRQVRGQIIGCIIQTDMAHHGTKMTKLDATSDFDAAKLADPKEDLEKLFWMEVMRASKLYGTISRAWFVFLNDGCVCCFTPSRLCSTAWTSPTWRTSGTPRCRTRACA